MKQCIIVGGAEFCLLPDLIPENAYIIACDGGYDRCLELGVTPDLIIGDMDSVKTWLPTDTEIIKAPPEKNDTDTMIAVKTAFERGFDSFVISGATGCGRMGHTMAAISTLEYIADHGGDGFAMDYFSYYYVQGRGIKKYPFCEVMAEDSTDSGDVFPFKYISVFALTDKAELSMRGLKYGWENMTLVRGFPLGVSNEFKERYGEIEVYSGKILVILET